MVLGKFKGKGGGRDSQKEKGAKDESKRQHAMVRIFMLDEKQVTQSVSRRPGRTANSGAVQTLH